MSSFRIWENYLRVWFKTSEIFCLVPIHWNPINKTLTTTKTRLRMLIYIVFYIYYVFDSIYLMSRILTISSHNLGFDDELKLINHGISRFFGAWMITSVLVNFNDLNSFFTHLYSMHHKLKGTYFGQTDAIVKDGVFGYMSFGVITVHVQPIGPLMQHLQERQSIRYWGSRYLPPDIYNSVNGIILFASIELLLSYIAIFGAGYIAIQLVVYTQTTRFWLTMLLKKNKQRTSVNIVWLNMANLKLYRTLRVLNVVHNDACKTFLWPCTQYMLAVIHVIVNVLTIKFFFQLPLEIRSILVLSTVAFSFFEQSCLKAAADVYEISKRYGENIRRAESKVTRRIGKGLRPLRLEVGNSYYFKMSTFTTFVETVIENTISVILTYKNA